MSIFQSRVSQIKHQWLVLLPLTSLIFVTQIAVAQDAKPNVSESVKQAQVSDDDPFADDTKTSNSDPFGNSKKVAQAKSLRKPLPRKVDHGDSPTKRIENFLEADAEFNYEETPFIEISEELENKYGVNVELTSSAKDDSLTEDEVITCALSGVNVRSMLRIMLEEKNATYIIQDGVLKIISLDEAEDEKWFRRKVINCQKLLDQLIVAERNYPSPKVLPTTQKTNKPDRTGGGGVFSIGTTTQLGTTQLGKFVTQKDKPKTATVQQQTPVPVDPKQAASAQLIHVIKNTVQTDSWRSSGNGLSSVELIGGMLVISANEKTIYEVEQLLNLLSEAHKISE